MKKLLKNYTCNKNQQNLKKTGTKFQVFSSACAIKNYTPIFSEKDLPLFEEAAPTQPCQVKKPDRKLFQFARKPQMEKLVQKIKTWSASLELNKR